MCLDCSVVEAVPPYSICHGGRRGRGRVEVATRLNQETQAKLKPPKIEFFFCIHLWMRGPCPSIKLVTVEKQPPKPRVRGSMYPAGFAGRD